MSKVKLLGVAVVIVVSAVSAFAATYVVPEDRVLIDQSHAIAVGRAIESHVRSTEEFGIETVTRFRIDEGIRGVATGEVISVTEPGGTYEGVTRVIAGTPVLRVDERVLLLLLQRTDGEYAILNLALGKFRFEHDTHGQALALRDEGEIVGWDSHLAPYVESRRSAEAFLNFVREQVKGHRPEATYYVPTFPLEPAPHGPQEATAAEATPKIAPFTAASYTIGNARRPGFPGNVTYGRGTSTEPGAPGGGDNAINAAMSAWNNVSGAAIKLAYSGQSRSDTGLGGNVGDGQNTIQFERNLTSHGINAFTCSGGGFSGTLGIGGFFSSGSHSGPNNETFSTISEGDVEMNQGIANCTLLFSNGDFNTAVAHEVGHSIGFRHSDQAPDGSPCQSASMECSQQAVMKSFIPNGINANPQTWDQHAAQAVYPGAVVCTNPSITVQPNGSIITAGQSANLSVTATGTGLTYQWYTGNPPSTANPVPGGTSSTLFVTPASTTTYWVRVTGQCGTPQDSNGATVTVNQPQCNNAQITGQPQSSSIIGGSQTFLVVSATGTNLTYQWFTGNSGDTSSPIQGATGASVAVTPQQTTSYWVRVQAACGNPVNSNTATITVGVCTSPSITGASAVPSQIQPGGSAQLAATVSGSVSSVQWYVGTPPDKSNPVPQSGATVSVSPTVTTTYWLQAVSGCGAASTNSQIVTVTVALPNTCAVPTITQPANQTIVAGLTTTITVSAGGNAPLHYQWYKGPAGNKTNKVGTDSDTITTDAVNSTLQYWVEVSNSCNGGTTVGSSTITITPFVSRHRATRH